MAQTDRTDGLVGHLGIKAPVRAATTAAITLSGEQTVDGVACVTGDRVLVKNQAAGADNGIYVVDTGDWSRARDCDGTYDVVQGSMVRCNSGSSNSGGLFVLSTSDPITIGTTSLTWSREAVNFVVKDSQTAIDGQTVVVLGSTYQVGSSNLEVYVNGLRQRLTADYTETTSASITFTYGLFAGDEIDCYMGLSIGNLTAALASAVSISDAGGYYLATTVEGALQERVDAITVDVGDADATLVYGTANAIQRWNTPLTATRTVTLSTTSAQEGGHFLLVRGAGATGNYDITVTGIGSLRVPGEWIEVSYDAGTAAWVLVRYGILPSAEILAMTPDAGDDDATLTVGTSARTARWATTLTADRSAILATTAVIYEGAEFEIIRAESATGAYSLKVMYGTAILARLAPGQACRVRNTGSAWVVAALSDLRNPLNSVVTLTDDFLGDEIDGSRWQSLIGTDSNCRQAVVLADQAGGVVRMVTGSDAGATMALNGVQLQSALNWLPSNGGFVWEGRIAISAITAVAVFVGITDQIATLEMPFTLGAGNALTSNASNAIGVLFDTGADDDNWWAVGVRADVDITKENLAVAPTAGTFETWRIEISATGVPTFYRNGSVIGSAALASIIPTAPVTPVVAAFARGAASRNIDADFLSTQMQR